MFKNNFTENGRKALLVISKHTTFKTTKNQIQQGLQTFCVSENPVFSHLRVKYFSKVERILVISFSLSRINTVWTEGVEVPYLNRYFNIWMHFRDEDF